MAKNQNDFNNDKTEERSENEVYVSQIATLPSKKIPCLLWYFFTLPGKTKLTKANTSSNKGKKTTSPLSAVAIKALVNNYIILLILDIASNKESNATHIKEAISSQ